MRVNVYSQEITNQVILIRQVSGTGVVYSGVRMILHSSEKLHYTDTDDDRSAVTFWLPRSAARREEIALAFERMAAMVRQTPEENR